MLGMRLLASPQSRAATVGECSRARDGFNRKERREGRVKRQEGRRMDKIQGIEGRIGKREDERIREKKEERGKIREKRYWRGEKREREGIEKGEKREWV